MSCIHTSLESQFQGLLSVDSVKNKLLDDVIERKEGYHFQRYCKNRDDVVCCLLDLVQRYPNDCNNAVVYILSRTPHEKDVMDKILLEAIKADSVMLVISLIELFSVTYTDEVISQSVSLDMVDTITSSPRYRGVFDINLFCARIQDKYLSQNISPDRYTSMLNGMIGRGWVIV